VINEKLSKRENEVMGAVFSLSLGKERFLAAPCEILAALPPKTKCDEESLERTLRSLELDGYFQLISSDRKGEKTYVFHMRDQGLAYKRSDVQRKRTLAFKWGVAAVGAVITFLIGLILRLIFK
jgi:hypothetical protein